MSFREYTHPDDIEHNLTLFHELIAGKRDAYQLEKRCFRKDGELIWTQVTASLERDADGAPASRSRCSRTSPSASSPRRRCASRRS